MQPAASKSGSCLRFAGLCLTVLAFFIPAQTLESQHFQENQKSKFIVERIEIAGNLRIETSTIVARISSRPGDPYDCEAVQRDAQALRDSGDFERVRLRVEDSPDRPDGKIVAFDVLEKPSRTDTTPPQSCPVTIGQKSDIDPAEFFGSASAHWENNFYVGGLWPDGTIVFRPNGPGHIYQDGSVGMKIAWYRGKGVRGRLKIQGKRLDAPAPLLRSHVSDYGKTGFQASEVIFPTEGCWQVTGTVGDARVTFVTRVVKLPGLKPNVAPPKS